MEDNGWWDSLPKNIKEDIEESIRQADRGEVFTHEQVKKMYPQWFLQKSED